MAGGGMRPAAATAGRGQTGACRACRCASLVPARSSCQYSELVIQRVLAPNPGPMTLAGTGTVVLEDQPGALGQYVASLERLISLGPRTIYPGHGPIVDDATGKLHEYLRHRRQRVQQVVDALAACSPSTVEELVRAIY